MGKKLLYIFGNGLTLDFLNHVNNSNRIDVRNLFKYGSCVKWPADNVPGFLSFKHCPNLWNLGARPQMSEQEAMSLIEDIITCVNVHAGSPQKIAATTIAAPNDIYLFAYKELSIYLRNLFVAYDSAMPISLDAITNWPWYEILKSANDDPEIEEISIVTYNYDIWLERMLRLANIPFCISVVEKPTPTPKIRIYKPHGSISFAHKQTRDPASFQIAYGRDLPDAPASDFSVTYDKLDQYYLVNAMIPPAGDSGRFNQTWAKEIRREIKKITNNLTIKDEVVICGLSYWHVDRAELDELFVALPQDVNVKMVNPNPNRSMNTVIASLFSNYISHSNASELKGAGL
ncbi:MAG: SIR2 family protein [Nitrospirae bacterium]|nr:SIR2 family protein [Nitrospirota bacterium]